MAIKFLLPLTALCTVLASAVAQAACPFNVTGNATADSMRDGVLLVRYARGLRGATLVAGTGANSATVEANIVANTDKLDVNGNGVFDIEDAAIIGRSVFGFNHPAWMPDGRAGAYATRNNGTKLKAFVDAGCPAPSVVSAPTPEQFAASRFLIQSTFGPSRADIATFLSTPGATQTDKATLWISAQSTLPRSQTHFQYLLTRKAEFDAAGKFFFEEMTREAFWGQALTSPDQLRQRLAFALSEILVVSSEGGSDNPHELAAYLDVLADNSLGNFRDLLYQTALSPAMGRYLSHLRNDGSNANPNENFAREVLQLFGVGLFKLGPDGEKLLSGGQPIATYDEDTVKGFAKVFTGLSYDDPYCKTGAPGYGIPRVDCKDGYGATHPDWNWSPDNTYITNNAGGEIFTGVVAAWNRPMIPFAGRHSALPKQLLIYPADPSPVAACAAAVALASAATNPGLLPAIDTTTSGVATRTKVNATQAYESINKAIDNIFCHPNVGPFIGKHLIRFFVTSTPSPAYVSRVAAVFNSSLVGGVAVRGDMKAVIQAVLLDPEATQASSTAPMTFGKLKEPMLRLSAILRGFNARSASGRYQLRYGLDSIEYGISQSPLQSATVFNYFHPEFAPPGPVSTVNAIGPEFEITTTTAIAATQNYFGGLVAGIDGSAGNSFANALIASNTNCSINTLTSADPSASSREHCMFGDLSDLFAVQADSNALFDYLNLVLMGGSLNASNKAALVAALDSASAFPPMAAPTVVNPPTAAYTAALSTWQSRRTNRVKAALWLAVHTPEFQIQR